MKTSWSELAKSRMKALGISQEALSEALGVTQGAVGHWLNHRRRAKIDEVIKILNLLGIIEFRVVDEHGTIEIDEEQLAPGIDSTISERFVFILSQMGWSQSEFAKKFGLSPQTVNNWIKRNSLSSQSAKTICETTGFSYKWLLNGEGAPIDKQEDGNDSAQITYIVAECEGEKDNSDFVEIPVLDLELSAGYGSYTDEPQELYSMPFRLSTLKRLGVNAKFAKIVTVNGDSMEPILSDGDKVAINMADTHIRDGKYYAIRMGDVLRIKVLIAKPDGSMIIRSVNPAYPDELISPDDLKNDSITILGRVWWSASYM